jgi:hypothetical protein
MCAQRKDHMEAPKDSHLQAKERGLRRKQLCGSQTSEHQEFFFFAVQGTQSVVFCYSSMSTVFLVAIAECLRLDNL